MYLTHYTQKKEVLIIVTAAASTTDDDDDDNNAGTISNPEHDTTVTLTQSL